MFKNILLILILSSFSAVVIAQDVVILSSPPDYNTMHVITQDALWQEIPADGAMSFGNAYKIFHENMKKIITENVKKYGFKGVVNLRVTHSVTERAYDFSATFDYFD